MENSARSPQERSDEWKKLGNGYFMEGHMNLAVENYTKAISCLDSNDKLLAPLYSNRSFAQFKLENYGASLTDSESAIAVDPLFPKSYYRKSSCLFVLGRLGEAIQELLHIQKTLGISSNSEVNDKIKYLRQLKREREFYSCIQYEDELEKLDVERIEVESSYQGPVIDRKEPLTREKVMEIIQYLKDQKKLHKKYLWVLCLWAIEVMSAEPNMVEVTVDGLQCQEIVVCGDIHGQYYDLLNIFNTNEFPCRERPYLFNGDFVDRGSFSVECVIALFLFKVLDPKCIYLNRGNHENPDMNKMYGFEGEVLAKYCADTFIVFKNVFYALPLAHCLNKKVLVLHGGLFEKEDVRLEDLNKINRKQPIPSVGLMCDMLWADPCNDQGRSKSQRGVSIQFGPDVAERFLNLNNLGELTRALGQVPSDEGGGL